MAAAQVPGAPVPALIPRARTRRPVGRLVLLILAAALAACGRHRVSYADGTPRFEGRSTADGERRGLWTYWYPDGGVREQGPYVDGRRAGLWRQWHRNGRKLSEGERVWSDATRSSEREGTWTFWDASGIVRARGVFRSGRRDGRWTFFDEAGEPDRLRSGLYAAGIRVD